jgi:hypothetical protein
MELHPQILEKDGKPAFVVLAYEEYVALTQALEDAMDSLLLREAKAEAKGRPTYTPDQVRKALGL